MYVIGVIAVSRRDIEDKLFRDFEPLVEGLGVDLLDVEFTSENRSSVLRATIHKAEGVTLDDCASVQRVLSDRLDETDPIQGSYMLEVSSPGLERSLRRDKEFGIFKGRPCRVNLFAPVQGKRTWAGELVGLDKDPAGSETVVLSTPDGVPWCSFSISKASELIRSSSSGCPRKLDTALATAIDTAAPEPSPEATGIVDVIKILQAGIRRTPKCFCTPWTVAARGWSSGSSFSSAERPMSGASICTDPWGARGIARTTARACTLCTGTARAGLP